MLDGVIEQAREEGIFCQDVVPSTILYYEPLSESSIGIPIPLDGPERWYQPPLKADVR